MKISVLLLITITLLSFCSCGQNNISLKEKKCHDLKNIDKHRNVFTGNDTLRLEPYELFQVMRFDSLEVINMGYHSEYLDFSNKCDEMSFELGMKGVKLSKKNKLNKTEKRVIISLKCFTGFGYDFLEREIIKGEEYKVIYAYRINAIDNRIPIATEMISYGYYIIDVVPLDAKFPRQYD